MRKRMVPYILLLVALPLVAACGDDPISYSGPVTLNLKAKSGEVLGAVVSDEKGITTENGNPYGAFVAAARSALERDPSRIEVASARLFLGGRSVGVTRLEEIFAGTVDVLFVMDSTDNSFPAAELTQVAGAGPLDMSGRFDSGGLGPEDFAKLLQGSFKVVVRGTAAPGFADKGAEADLQVTFEFAAYE